MQCNVATTRCPDRLAEFFCIFFAAWLCRGTSEPRGTWPDRAVPHHLCVSSFYQFSLENIWEPIRLRELNPQQTEVTSRTPGGLVGQIYIMRFDLKSFTISDTKVIMIQKALTPQLSREAGFGCPGLLGHLHLGGRVSETRLFFSLENIRYFFYLYGFIFFCRWTQSEWEWGLHSDGPTKWGLWGELILFNPHWAWNFLKMKTTLRMRLWDWNTAEIMRDGKNLTWEIQMILRNEHWFRIPCSKNLKWP